MVSVVRGAAQTTARDLLGGRAEPVTIPGMGQAFTDAPGLEAASRIRLDLTR